MTTLLLAVAGGTGAVLRFVQDALLREKLSHEGAILLVNVAGSALLGAILGAYMWHHVSAQLVTIAGVGFCGGYTTFSTTSVASVRRFALGEPGLAAANVIGTLILTTVAAGGALVLMSRLHT